MKKVQKDYMKRLKYGVSLSQRNRRKRISPYFHKDIAVLN